MLDFGPGSFFLTPSQIADSPSSRHGIPLSIEKALRFYACEIIQEAGILLRMPQAVMSTAQVLLHRFFCKQSFRDFDARSVAAGCFWLSMKLEEEGTSNRGEKPSRLKDVVMVFDRMRLRRHEEGDPPVSPDSPAFKRKKEDLLKLETRILVELGFVCHVEHPHKFLLGYLNQLDASEKLVQEAWNLVNDSLRSTLCVTVPSNVVACGVVYTAARRVGVPLPENPPWWSVFSVSFDQIMEVCLALSDLYRLPQAKYVDVRNDILSPSGGVPTSSARDSVNAAEQRTSQPFPFHPRHSLELSNTDCKQDVCIVNSSSQSESLNGCVLNASGIHLSRDLATGCTLPAQQESNLKESGEKRPKNAVDGNDNDMKPSKLHRSGENRSYYYDSSNFYRQRDDSRRKSSKAHHNDHPSHGRRVERGSENRRSSRYCEDRRHHYKQSLECVRA